MLKIAGTLAPSWQALLSLREAYVCTAGQMVCKILLPQSTTNQKRLAAPVPEDGLVADASKLPPAWMCTCHACQCPIISLNFAHVRDARYVSDRQEYNRRAHEWTIKHAF